MTFTIRYKSSVEKDLRPIPMAIVHRLLETIDALARDQHPHGSIKLKDAERLYRIRVGDYRIVYEIDASEREIVVHYVRHRREVYRLRR
jgi:mRNA interferase RelE/StbE